DEERHDLEISLARRTERAAGYAPPGDVWEPLQGGTWGEREGELLGTGLGTGPFEFAALVRGDAPASARYRVSVEISLESGEPGAYAGIVFGAKNPSDFYLAYIFFDRTIEQEIDPRELAKFKQETGVSPKVIRLARMVGGKWQMRGNKVVAFPDSGFVPVALEVAGGSAVKIEIDHKPAIELALDGPLDGRVGILKFYDTVARFRAWEWTPLP